MSNASFYRNVQRRMKEWEQPIPRATKADGPSRPLGGLAEHAPPKKGIFSGISAIGLIFKYKTGFRLFKFVGNPGRFFKYRSGGSRRIKILR